MTTDPDATTITPSPRYYAPQLDDAVFYDAIRLLATNPHANRTGTGNRALIRYLNEEAQRRFFRDWLSASLMMERPSDYEEAC